MEATVVPALLEDEVESLKSWPGLERFGEFLEMSLIEAEAVENKFESPEGDLGVEKRRQ